eukprot:Gb_24096 [translate_table: standard]
MDTEVVRICVLSTMKSERAWNGLHKWRKRYCANDELRVCFQRYQVYGLAIRRKEKYWQ